MKQWRLAFGERESPDSAEPKRGRSSAGGALPFRAIRNEAELAHQPYSVRGDVGVDDLSVCDVMNCDAFQRHFPVCGANSPKLTFMRAGNGPGSCDLVLFDDGVLDRETQIGEGRQENCNLSPVSFGANGGAGRIVVVKSVAGGN